MHDTLTILEIGEKNLMIKTRSVTGLNLEAYIG